MRIVVILAAVMLAGCTGPEEAALPMDPNGGGDASDPVDEGFAPIGQQKSAGNLDTPGVEVHGTMDTCEAGYCLDGSASNDGPDSYYITRGHPDSWSDRLERHGQVVEHREGGITMPAFQDEEFAPGDVDHVALEWDGRLRGSDGSMEEAPDGAYTWVLVFDYYDDPAAEGRHTIEVAFDVIVGAS